MSAAGYYWLKPYVEYADIDFANQYDIYAVYNNTIYKINANTGNIIWTKSLDPGIILNSIRLGENGEIYVSGSYSGSVDFDAGPAFDVHDSSTEESNFVMRLNDFQ